LIDDRVVVITGFEVKVTNIDHTGLSRLSTDQHYLGAYEHILLDFSPNNREAFLHHRQ
jgi:hypothetical protein